MQQPQSQVIPSIAQPQTSGPTEIVVLDDQLLSQVSGGVIGPGGGWANLVVGPGAGW